MAFAIGSVSSPFECFIAPQTKLNADGRTVVHPRLVAGERTLTLVVGGQSLATNISPTPYTPTNAKVHNLSIFDGGMYQAVDPLIGGHGLVGGTWLSRLGDELIDADIVDRVILVPVAVGSTKAVDWDIGNMSARMGVAYRRLAAHGITPDAILFQLGESDGIQGTSTASWAASMNSAIAKSRAAGITAPWIVAKSTWVDGASTAIRAGVDAIVNGVDVLYGPDFDTLNNTYRFDTIHFNDLGQATAATMWLDVLGGVL